MKNKINLEKGETLIESIIALAMIVAIATGIVIAVVTALSGTTFNQASNSALNYAQQGSDLIKDQVISDFDTFTHQTGGVYDYPSGYYCLAEDDTALDPGDTGNYDPNGNTCNPSNPNIGKNYLRRIYLRQDGIDPRSGVNKQVCVSGTVFVASIVSWADSKCSRNTFCHQSEIDACFSNRQSVIAP